MSIGGGTITNATGASIYGQNNTGTAAAGNGILVDDSNGGAAYAATTVTNSGTIRGYSGFGIKMIGSYNDTITNNAGGTIRGAGTGAAIQTGDGADTVTNAGAIIGDNGSAIDLEGGNDTLKIQGGSANITGDVSAALARTLSRSTSAAAIPSPMRERSQTSRPCRSRAARRPSPEPATTQALPRFPAARWSSMALAA